MKGRCCCGSGRWCLPCSGLAAALFSADGPCLSSRARWPAPSPARRSSHDITRCRISACRWLLSVAHHRARRRRLSGARPPARRAWPACSTPSAGGPTAASTRRMRGLIAAVLRGHAHRPERPARHLPDRHLHRRRAGAAGAAGRCSANCPACPACPALQFYEWAVLAHRRDRPRRGVFAPATG